MSSNLNSKWLCKFYSKNEQSENKFGHLRKRENEIKVGKLTNHVFVKITKPALFVKKDNAGWDPSTKKFNFKGECINSCRRTA